MRLWWEEKKRGGEKAGEVTLNSAEATMREGSRRKGEVQKRTRKSCERGAGENRLKASSVESVGQALIHEVYRGGENGGGGGGGGWG
eukprot:745708-Hanusia_phi.AAC.5